MPGTTFLARAIAIPPDVHCPILKQAESFRIALGEHDGKSFYRASLVMKSPEAAAQVKAIADGVQAIASLKFSGDADVMKLVDGLKATAKDNTVRVRWDASADDVWTVVGETRQEGRRTHEEGRQVPVRQRWQGGQVPGRLPVPGLQGQGQGRSREQGQGGKCPAGCQCPACKAKAEKAEADAKAKADK